MKQTRGSTKRCGERPHRRRQSPASCTCVAWPPLVIDQVLFALQERTRMNCRTNEDQLQRLCNALLTQRLSTIFDAAVGPPGRFVGAFLKGFAGHAGRLLLDPDTEKAKDVWNLAAFGHSGTLAFTAISQPWLRAAAKRGCSTICPNGAVDHVGGPARSHAVDHSRGDARRSPADPRRRWPRPASNSAGRRSRRC